MKLPILGGLIVWFSALWTILGIVISLAFPNRGQLFGTGILLGSLLYFVCDVYVTGYLLNSAYFQLRIGATGKIKIMFNCLLGLISDSIVPWYAVIRSTRKYETISKQIPSSGRVS